MLVLSRRLGERIWIGGNICITVMQIERGKVRIGIDAPRDVPIVREEIRETYNQKEDNETTQDS